MRAAISHSIRLVRWCQPTTTVTQTAAVTLVRGSQLWGTPTVQHTQARTIVSYSSSTPTEPRVLIPSSIHPKFVGPAPVLASITPCAVPTKGEEPPQGAQVPQSMVAGYKHLLKVATEHPFWSNSIFQHRRELSLNEWKLFFEHDYYDSCSFTRYIGGLLWRCDDDLLRSRLTANLYEESGETDENERHAELLRQFLIKSLGADISTFGALPAAVEFTQAYLKYSAHEDPLYCAAFLSIGTEGVQPNLFQRLVDGMLHGVASGSFKHQDLKYFHIHIGCDDAHAGTLAEVMFKYAGVYQRTHPSNPDGWVAIAESAIVNAMNLRTKLYEAVYAQILQQRKQQQRIQAATQTTQPTRTHQPQQQQQQQQQRA